MKNLTFLLVLSFFVLFFGCEKSSEPITSEYDYVGILLDEQDNPVPNAEVFLISTSDDKSTTLLGENIISVDTTDEDGVFAFKNIKMDISKLKLRIIHRDFKTFEDFFAKFIEKGKKNSARIKLAHHDNCCGKIIIHTLTADSVPISGVQVRLNRNKEVVRKTHSNDHGTVVFENVCPGQYWLRVAKEHYQVIEYEFNLQECDTLEYYFFLQAKESDTCCNGRIQVEVKDKSNGSVINGAKVKLRRGSDVITWGETKENQPVVFENLCPGKYNILVIKDGYKPIEREINLDCNQRLEVTAELEVDTCCNGAIKVIVLNQENQPISQAKVNLWKNGVKIKDATTNNDGYVIFNNLCNGKYGIDVIKEGFKAIEFLIELGCNEEKVITKVIEHQSSPDSCCNGLLILRVKDKSTNESLNGAKVKMWKHGAVVNTAVVSEGKVVFKNICPGTYGFSVIYDTYKTLEFELKFECNDTLEKTVYLEKESKDTCCNGKVILYVKDSTTNQPIVSANVSLWKGSTKINLLTTNENGRVVFENLCEGEYSFGVTKEGYYGREFTFKVDCNQTYEFVMRLLQKHSSDTCCTAKLKVRVIDDSTETAISGAKVIIYHSGTAIADPVTNSEGWAYRENLCAPATYTVRVIKDGYQTKEFTVTFNECKTIAETIRLKKE